MGLGDADQPGMGTEEIMNWLDETANTPPGQGTSRTADPEPPAGGVAQEK